MADRIRHHTRLGQSLAVGQEYLHRKLVAVGVWEQAYLQRRGNKTRQQDDTYAAIDSEAWMGKGPVEHLIVGSLHPFGDRVTSLSGFIEIFRFYQ